VQLKRPNFLIIQTDQHNPGIAGYAGDRLARTQALDALAERSTVFDAAYCQAPLCVPSRLSMLTGRYVGALKAWNNSCELGEEHLTFSGHLGRHGYTTALVGKMHLAGPRWMGGFQHRPYGDLCVDRFCFHQPDPVDTWDGRWCSHSVGRFPWAGETEIPESLLADANVTRESLAFLLEHADREPERPWLLVAGYSRPHFPLTAPGRYFRRAARQVTSLPPKPPGYPDTLHPHDRYIVEDFRLLEFPEEDQVRALAAYYACVEYVEDCIAELLDGLRKAGLLDGTYVIYLSDHGDMCAQKGLWCKRTYYDASARVPLMISGPDIASGVRVARPVELTDLFPTLCELGGAPVPEGLDGLSLAPLLGGDASGYRRRYARSELLTPLKQTAFRMARDGRWKYVEFPEAPPRLFDMVNDPEEATDLLASGPAPGDCPLEDLREAARLGVSWDGIARMQERDLATRPPRARHPGRGPVQYFLRGARVDGDAFLYPGLTQAGDRDQGRGPGVPPDVRTAGRDRSRQENRP